MVYFREFPHSFAEALRLCREILAANQDLVRKNTIESESEQLVIGAHRSATGEKLTRAQFFSRLSDRLSEPSAEQVLIYAGRRAQGAPLQHILGYQQFLDHEYRVDSSTLIPRPETEILVCEAMRDLSDPRLGIEIGLGSGVIAIELLSRFPKLRMIASETSEEAANLARKNATAILGSSERLKIIRPNELSDVLACFAEPMVNSEADFLISNPPYLDASAPGETDLEVSQHEPRSALFPETGNPLYFYEKIASGSQALLKKNGKVFLEIAAERAKQTQALFSVGWKTRVIQDLTGRARVLIAEMQRAERNSHG